MMFSPKCKPIVNSEKKMVTSFFSVAVIRDTEIKPKLNDRTCVAL